jgi:hypothetical protein
LNVGGKVFFTSTIQAVLCGGLNATSCPTFDSQSEDMRVGRVNRVPDSAEA